MDFMKEWMFYAHALRDYLRPSLDASDLQIIDGSMRAGEPVAAVTWAFAAAEELHVVIEKFYIDQLFQLPNISAELAESLIDVTSALRIYEAAA